MLRLRKYVTQTHDKDVHGRTKTLVEQEGLFEVVWLFHLGAKGKDSHVSSVGKHDVGES